MTLSVQPVVTFSDAAVRSRKSNSAGFSLIIKTVLLVLIFLSLSMYPVSASQSTFVIPLEGGRWRTYSISIFVPVAPSWAHNATLRAMSDWNAAQAWFASIYYPGSSYYILLNGGNSSAAQVQLLDTHATDYTTLKIVPRFQKDNATIVSVVVHVGTIVDEVLFHEIVMHELGHVLGLGHVKCCYQEDLMYPIANPYAARQYFPSTLDLYALHVLATERTIPSSVMLPVHIQYLTVPEQIFAELSVTPLIEPPISVETPSSPKSKWSSTLVTILR